MEDIRGASVALTNRALMRASLTRQVISKASGSWGSGGGSNEKVASELPAQPGQK